MTYRYPSIDTKNLPKGVVVCFHGYGSHSDKTAYIAKSFSDCQYEVIAYDC